MPSIIEVMYHILLVEDSVEYQKIIQHTFPMHKVTTMEDVDSALHFLKNTNCDLILLDIGLPKKNGYSLLSELQSLPHLSGIPIICLTGKTEITDKTTAFSLGADDYIVKPFDPIELRVRVDGKLNKSNRQKSKADVTVLGALEINHGLHKASLHTNGAPREIHLTQTEFKLLVCLVRRPEQVFSRDQLLVAAWGESAKVLDRAVDVHVCSLRKKLLNYGGCVKSVPGVGYKFVPEKT